VPTGIVRPWPRLDSIRRGSRSGQVKNLASMWVLWRNWECSRRHHYRDLEQDNGVKGVMFAKSAWLNKSRHEKELNKAISAFCTKRVYIENFFKYLGFCWSVCTTLLISEIRVQKVTAPFSCNTWAVDCYLLKRRSCIVLHWIGDVGWFRVKLYRRHCQRRSWCCARSAVNSYF
jgi:hypothetical protein